jgi:hypothetical protein
MIRLIGLWLMGCAMCVTSGAADEDVYDGPTAIKPLTVTPRPEHSAPANTVCDFEHQCYPEKGGPTAPAPVGEQAGDRLEEMMRARLQEAAIVLAILTNEDRLHCGLHAMGWMSPAFGRACWPKGAMGQDGEAKAGIVRVRLPNRSIGGRVHSAPLDRSARSRSGRRGRELAERT